MAKVYDRQIVNSAGANNMTGTATVTSDWVNTDFLERLVFEIQATGTPNGTLSVEGTNQTGADGRPNANATPIALTSPTSPALPSVAGAAVAALCAMTTIAGGQGGCKFVRVKYVNSSGTGKLDVYAHGYGP